MHTTCCSPRALLWPHTATNLSIHLPVNSVYFLLDRYLVLKQGKAVSHFKWQQSLKTWSSTAVMSSALTNYQSWQVFMRCFADQDFVCLCASLRLCKGLFITCIFWGWQCNSLPNTASSPWMSCPNSRYYSYDFSIRWQALHLVLCIFKLSNSPSQVPPPRVSQFHGLGDSVNSGACLITHRSQSLWFWLYS